MFDIFYAGSVSIPEENPERTKRTVHGERMVDLRMGLDFYTNAGHIILRGTLPITHTFIGTSTLSNKEDVFEAFQGEFCGVDFHQTVRDAGATHTSMSVGDIIIDRETKEMWFCDRSGWVRV